MTVSASLLQTLNGQTAALRYITVMATAEVRLAKPVSARELLEDNHRSAANQLDAIELSLVFTTHEHVSVGHKLISL